MSARRKRTVRRKVRAKPGSARLHWKKPRKIRTARGLVDPYFGWASATKFAYYGKRRWMPAIIELDGLTVGQFKRKLQTRGAKNVLRLPPTRARKAFESSTFFPGFVTEDFIPALRRDAILRGMIKRFELSRGTGPTPRGGSR